LSKSKDFIQEGMQKLRTQRENFTGSFSPQRAAKYMCINLNTLELFLNKKFVPIILEVRKSQLKKKQDHSSVLSVSSIGK
jgi:hypothetical protein